MMDELKSFFLVIFGIIIGMVVSIIVMIKGWGVKPQSWWWIIGVNLIGHIIAQTIVEIAKK
jgi:RsiW-degrading membrane proteinase PrsW (M82 family)